MSGLVDESVTPIKWAQPGTKAGLKELHQFLHQRLAAYSTKRNDPTKKALSNLSPWFHFGGLFGASFGYSSTRLKNVNPNTNSFIGPIIADLFNIMWQCESKTGPV